MKSEPSSGLRQCWANAWYTGYTSGMKTAVSVPDDVFHDADATASRLGWTRSQLYTRAVSEFLERTGDDPVTEALNALADDQDPAPSVELPRELIERGDWEW